MKDYMVYFIDSFVQESEALISFRSASFQYGINVFEGIRAYYSSEKNDLYLFRLRDHIIRLFRSAEMLDLRFEKSMTCEFVENKIIELIRLNNFKEDIYIRASLFLDDDGGWISNGPVSLLLSAFPKGRSYENMDGISCCVSSWRRINDGAFPPRIKAGPNYLNSRLALLEAKRNGFDYCVFLNDRQSVSEGPGACIFMVRDEILITPPLYASILESINRDSFLKIARNSLGLVVEEREIDRTELYIADEIFMAGTAIEIKPVCKIDHMLINGEKVGSITKKMTDLYFSIVRNEIVEYKDWLSPVYMGR
ncbi:MAG: branched-chain-amino-acid transaminase [Firmicutes bacterium]|jgi:branched-chain amino acid aminotransferase|nr:branched-chain-amino-acid transaminase [Bacillota bacterium]